MLEQKSEQALTAVATIHSHFNLYVFVVAALALLMLTGFVKSAGWSKPEEVAPGILVYGEPLQADVTKESWQEKNYTLTPLANYEITARILSKKSYSSERAAELSPVDLALGWQEMSDSSVLDNLTISQKDRWYYVSWRNSLLGRDDIIRHSANTHILPASPEVAELVNTANKNEVVRLQGYLVEVTSKDGFLWRSSVSRTDTGDGSCEVFWVESVEVMSTETLQASAGTPVIHQH
jgi:hypothetical protein